MGRLGVLKEWLRGYCEGVLRRFTEKRVLRRGIEKVYSEGTWMS